MLRETSWNALSLPSNDELLKSGLKDGQTADLFELQKGMLMAALKQENLYYLRMTDRSKDQVEMTAYWRGYTTAVSHRLNVDVSLGVRNNGCDNGTCDIFFSW